VNLLCRQVKLIRGIEIVSPESPLCVRLPNCNASDDFPGCLQTLAAWTVNGIISVSTALTETAADYTIFVGAVQLDLVPNHGHSLLLVGDGWRAWVGDPRCGPMSVWPTSSNPLGPFLAAALAAGEIFKHSRGIRRGKFLSEAGYSLWSVASSSNWEALKDGPRITDSSLPPVHLVGLGAVGNALAYTIANLGLSDIYLVLVDDDCYDDTNLNRCLVAGWEDLGLPKVHPVSRALKAVGIAAFPFVGTIKSYMASGRSGLRTDVAKQVDDLNFGIVLSCVDKGASRQDVQGLRPSLLLGGSTLDLKARANRYTGQPGAACLACFNPVERDGERIRILEHRLRMMQPDERGRFLRNNGLNVEAVEEYLASAKCGALGEAALRDFATHPPPEFSAGFVSLAAGLLLAAALLRSSAFAESSPRRGDMTTLNLLNGGLLDSWLGADDTCEQKCQGSPWQTA
jgi:hypothetical protein